MKWLGVAILALLALVCLFEGLVVGADAEGRGGKWMLALWAVAVVLVVAAIMVALIK